MATKKTTTKKSPTGAPLGNPLKFFREGGEKTKAMFKNGGYNVPKNSLPRKDNGGGSGMGSMYKNDQAFDTMMDAPASEPVIQSNEQKRFYNPLGETTPGPMFQKKGGSVKRKKK